MYFKNILKTFYLYLFGKLEQTKQTREVLNMEWSNIPFYFVCCQCVVVVFCVCGGGCFEGFFFPWRFCIQESFIVFFRTFFLCIFYLQPLAQHLYYNKHSWIANLRRKSQEGRLKVVIDTPSDVWLLPDLLLFLTLVPCFPFW